jgi:Tol biopolymer transport system component
MVMSSLVAENGRLDGWKAISEYLGWHERTVMRWEQQRGLPIHRVPGGQRHAVFAFRKELDEWLNSGHFDNKGLDEDPEFPPKTGARVHPTPAIPRIAPTQLVAISATKPAAIRFRERINLRKVIWITSVVVLLTAVGYAVHSLAFRPRIEFTGVVQLTNDGTQKEGLVTDGKTVYFSKFQDSRVTLASVSNEGGAVRTIATPFTKVVPTDISADGKKLLVLAWEGIEVERALWIVPVAGGQPRQVGQIHCHAAVWAPDGHEIAFASQNAIYLTDDNGTSIQRVQAFDSTPLYLRWSQDGRRLRFNLQDPNSPTFSFWELSLSDQDQNQVASLVPLKSSLTDCWARSLTLDARGRSFIDGGDCGKERIYVLEKRQAPWNSRFDLLPTNSVIHHPTDLAADPESTRIFAIGDSAGPQSNIGEGRLDLIRFDVRTREFRPFLPGIAADFVDFSRDGKAIAYIREQDQTLWIAASDGTAARQIEFPTSHLELPRWSPDGKRLAFMAQLPGKPWRIFVDSRDGGKPREASSGTDNQGAPTWSPDGKWLVYGGVECQEPGTCAIHKIDLPTGQEYLVTGSEGLGTARWSPDGRFIAALSPTRHEVLVFSSPTQQWRKLVEGVNGNDLSWSSDSRYLYASRPAGNQPEILRISLKDAKAEAAVDLRSFTEMTGHINTWFALAPDGSIIFSREITANEIYSLTYAEK